MQTTISDKKLIITLDGIAHFEGNIIGPERAKDILQGFVRAVSDCENSNISEIEINLNNLNITDCYLSEQERPLLNADELQLDERIAERIVDYINTHIANYLKGSRGYLFIPILKEVERVVINMRNCYIHNHNAKGRETGLSIIPLILSSSLKELQVNIEQCTVYREEGVYLSELDRYLTIEPRLNHETEEQKSAPEIVVRVNHSIFRRAGIQVFLCETDDDNKFASNATVRFIIENSRFMDYMENPVKLSCARGASILHIHNTIFSNFDSWKNNCSAVLNLTGLKEVSLQNVAFFEPNSVPSNVKHYIYAENVNSLSLGPIKFGCRVEETESHDALIYVSPSVGRICITGELESTCGKPVLEAPSDKIIMNSSANKTP